MARADISVLSIMEDKPVSAVSEEVAATALQQQLMEAAGELQPVDYIGPGGKFIEGFYSAKDRAFLPKFNIDR